MTIQEDVERLLAVLKWATRDPDPPHRCRYCSEPASSGHHSDCWVGEAYVSYERIQHTLQRYDELEKFVRQLAHDGHTAWSAPTYLRKRAREALSTIEEVGTCPHEEELRRLKQHADRECGCQVKTHALSSAQDEDYGP